MKYSICVINNKRKGAYTRGGAYILVEKRVTNLGGLYSGELIHGGEGGYLRNFTVSQLTKWKSYLKTHISIHIRFAVLSM